MSSRWASFSFILALVAPLSFLPAAQGQAPDKTTISEGKREDGFLIHTVECPQQDRATRIRILLPSRLEKDRRYPVLYILPVEAGDGNRYGDGLAEVKKLGLHDKYGLICVAPTFARLPWYADHPTDSRIHQESYLLKVVLPFVEKQYPAQSRSEGRLLLGFSKSGWGAFALLLRHPEVFGKAAAWDAPLDMDAPGKYGSGEIFATRENFERYRVSKLLAESEKLAREKGKRLALLGYGNFRTAHQTVHAQMQRLKIPHEYQDGPARKHDWHSGWVAVGVEFLAGSTEGK